jgi:hypothetical protein
VTFHEPNPEVRPTGAEVAEFVDAPEELPEPPAPFERSDEDDEDDEDSEAQR